MARKNAKDIGKVSDETPLHSSKGDTNIPLEERAAVLTEEEQNEVINQLYLQNERDISFFTKFLNVPAFIILLLHMYSAYLILMSQLKGTVPHIPFVGSELKTTYPLVGTEIAVLSVQLSLYTLGDRILNTNIIIASVVLAALGLLHSISALPQSILEFMWWLLPAVDVLLTTYAKWTMSNSREEIVKLAKKKYDVKSA